MPYTRTVPMGVGATRAFVAEVAALAGVDASALLDGTDDAARTRLPWYSRSVDSTYLTGKRVFVFGDATHAIAAARVAVDELGFTLVGLGTYSREFARDVRAAAERHGLEALVTDDYLAVERAIAAAAPELVLGTQMERHIAKRLGIACAVISTPIHVQDVPARYSPVYGFEGANVLFDSWVHPLMMGLEEHLLHMFRDDFEFHDGAGASHLGRRTVSSIATEPEATNTATIDAASLGAIADATVAVEDDDASVLVERSTADGTPTWEPAAESELRKIPFFVRGKARRNTERYAGERGLATISLETLYDAKAHHGR